MISGKVSPASDEDGSRKISKRGLQRDLSMFNVVAQRLRNGILQELLVDFEAVAVNGNYLSAVEVQGHYTYKDQDTGNQIKQRYTVGQAHVDFRKLNGFYPDYPETPDA